MPRNTRKPDPDTTAPESNPDSAPEPAPSLLEQLDDAKAAAAVHHGSPPDSAYERAADAVPDLAPPGLRELDDDDPSVFDDVFDDDALEEPLRTGEHLHIFDIVAIRNALAAERITTLDDDGSIKWVDEDVPGVRRAGIQLAKNRVAIVTRTDGDNGFTYTAVLQGSDQLPAPIDVSDLPA